MGDTLTTIDGVLKRHYLDFVADLMNHQKKLYSRLQKTSDEVQAFGSGFIAFIPTITGHNEAGIGWAAEDGNLPTAGNMTTTQAQVALAYLYGSIRLTGQTIKASRKREGALAKAVELQMESLTKRLGAELNRVFWGRGTGALSKITAASATPQGAGTLFTVDDASRLAEGQIVEMWSTNAGSGGAQTAGTPTISKVDYINNKIAFLAAQNITQNDFIYRSGSRGLVGMGVEGIADGADSGGNLINTTFQNINRSTTFHYHAAVIDNGGALQDLDLTLIQRLLDAIETLNGEEVSALWSNLALRASYINLLVADKRYVNTLELDGGWKAVEYSSGGGAIPWFAERMCLPNRLFALKEDTLQIHLGQDKPMDWVKAPGEGVLQRVAGKDAYYGTGVSYVNLGVTEPNKNGVLRDVR